METCKYCKIVFEDKIKWNDYNRYQHITACEKKYDPKSKRISQFFVKVSKETAINNIIAASNSHINTNTQINHHFGSQESVLDTLNDSDSNESCSSSDQTNYTTTTTTTTTIRFCEGLKLGEDVFKRFPMAVFTVEKDKLSFMISGANFHYEKCFKNNFLLNNTEGRINRDCQDLEHNTKFKKLLNSENYNPYQRYDYSSHNQLKTALEQKNFQINESKLKILNYKRQVVRFETKLTDQKRLMLHIANNDIPRINQLLKVSMNSKESVNKTILRMNAAIDLTYK
jgi:hypothetical protein